MNGLSVEPAEDELGGCACCTDSVGLRGFVYENGVPRAVYFVEPIGAPNFPMIKLGIVAGEWSRGSPVSTRSRCALLCKPTQAGPQIKLFEADLLAFPEYEKLGLPLSSAELSKSLQLDNFIEIARAVIDQDLRLAAIRAVAAPVPPRPLRAEPM